MELAKRVLRQWEEGGFLNLRGQSDLVNHCQCLLDRLFFESELWLLKTVGAKVPSK